MATASSDYDFKRIEGHWQSFWEENETFRAVDFAEGKREYILSMFPYPSGNGLHLGHSECYTPPDIIARYKRARGYNIMQPMGWDAFGLPTEQTAIESGVHPREITERNKDYFRGQLKRHGFSIDWDREIDTSDPSYYRWTQWVFLRMFKHGLAYVAEEPVWWCPALNTVLANEEVFDGRSERGRHPVERRNLRQWILRITAYAERLLGQLRHLNWPESTKRQQEVWIGRSEGAEIVFSVDSLPNETIEVFTTRPDTLFGATYMVLAPEHPLVAVLTTDERQEAVRAYVARSAIKSDLERTDLAKEKTGVFTGSYAINPTNGAKIPIWIADYVLMSYGTGAVMAVPAHDERDFEFAREFHLPVIPVIKRRDDPTNGEETELPFIEPGIMINSAAYTGLDSIEGGLKITADLQGRGLGRPRVNYRLRDFLFSRQRYWGEPVPILWVSEASYKRCKGLPDSPVAASLPDEPISCTENGEIRYALPLPEDQLPLTLPATETFKPSGSGESPLANMPEWLEVWFNLRTGQTKAGTSDPPAGEDWVEARRETNTMPQWAGSCWYHIRYCDPGNHQALIDPKIDRYWGAPDIYIGGAEHAVLHLLYARFWHYFLHDIGAVSNSEPYPVLHHQGMILGEDGEKMSKSRGNVVNPDRIIDDYGADSLRLFLMFMGPLQDAKPWSGHGVQGVHRFLRKIWRIFLDREGRRSSNLVEGAREEPDTRRLLHETIKKVTEDIERLHFNTAVSQMMIFANHLQKTDSISLDTALKFAQILAPFAPHFAEEIWAQLGRKPSISEAPWPRFDPSLLERDAVRIAFQINGRVRGDSMVAPTAAQEEVLGCARDHPRVAHHLEGKAIRKVVYVPGKILNIVTD